MSEGTRTPQTPSRGRGDAFVNYVVVLLGFAVLAAVVVLFVGWRQEERIPEVDFAADAARLAQQAPYPAYAPAQVPEGWVPTSSRLDPGGTEGEPVRWELGFATDSDEYASLRISDAEPAEFVAEMTENGEPAGEQTVAGQRWQRYASTAQGRRSLVREVDGATLVVTGTADYPELAELAATLEPR